MWQPFDKIDNETKSQMPFEYGIRPVAALKSNIQIDYSLLNFFHFFLASVDLVFFFSLVQMKITVSPFAQLNFSNLQWQQQ